MTARYKLVPVPCMRNPHTRKMTRTVNGAQAVALVLWKGEARTNGDGLLRARGAQRSVGALSWMFGQVAFALARLPGISSSQRVCAGLATFR
jgi:hypothetical protein